MIKTMLRIIVVAILVIASNGNMTASSRTYIYDRWYTVDTLQCSKVGPGTTYTSIKFTSETGSLTFRTFFLHVDVDNPNMKFEMELGRDSLIGGEGVSAHAIRKTEPGRYYIAGANADFYQTSGYVGVPVHSYIQGGQAGHILYSPSEWMFLIEGDRTPWVSTITESTTLSINGGASININRINVQRLTNELVLFNSQNGKYTHTAAGGKEIALRLADGEKWQVNGPMKFIVSGEVYDGGNMAIEPGQAVLSADGTAMATVESLKEGDEVTILVTQSMNQHNGATPSITGTVGGSWVLVQDGVVPATTNMDRHPRTMYGYTKDKKQMVICVLDGRSGISSGSIYLEMGDIMKYAGADWAINADGGGSSTLYIQNLGIMNQPSDGKERAVSNGMYLVLETPEDNEIASIEFKDWAMQFPKYGIYRPIIYGYNKYGMLIDTDVKGVTLSCDAALGHIENGNTFVGDGDGTHALTAHYGDQTASIPVTVVASDNVAIRLPKIINDTFREYTVEVQSEVNETMMLISSSALSWATDDASIVQIDPSTGVLKGVADGETTVRGNIGEYEGALTVSVQAPTSHAMPIDKEMDASTWTITSAGTSGLTMSPIDNGMELKYTGASSRSPYIKLAKKQEIWSLPDSVRIRINPGDAVIKSLTITLTSNSGEATNINFLAKNALIANTENSLTLAIDSIYDADDMINYPISVNSLILNLSSITKDKEYTISIPGFEAIYNAIPYSGVDPILADRNKIGISPNPIAQGDVINITLPCSKATQITVCDLTGKTIETAEYVPINGIATLDSANLNKGVYLLQITQNGMDYTEKIIIK